MAKTILVVGKDGQVGFELTRSLSVLGKVVAVGRAACDMSDDAQVRKIVQHVQPDVIVNASAYTAVDKAEQETELAMAINARAVGTLAELAKASGALLVHYSTDYVYAGDKDGAYVESDATGPRSAYGRTKLAGEDLVRARSDKHFIFRTSWVYGAYGANFLKTMLRVMQERDALRVVADQHGAPTSSALIADVTAHAVAAYLKGPDFDLRNFGTYHLAAGGRTTWHGYAQLIGQTAQSFGAPLKVDPAAIAAIATEDYPLPAPRPSNSRMDTSKLKAAFGLELPHWEDDVRRVVRQLTAR